MIFSALCIFLFTAGERWRHGGAMDPLTFSVIKMAYATGWLVAAPIGPVNLEIIRRALREHPSHGLAVGLGACCIDAAYLFLFSLGIGTAARIPGFREVAFIAGGLLLSWLGIGAIREGRKFLLGLEDPHPEREAGVKPPGSFLKCYLIGLGMTATNPMTVAFWSALALNFTAYSFALKMTAVVATLLGCLSWVLLIIGLLSVARAWVGPKLFGGVTLAGGLTVLYYGMSFLVRGARVEEWLAQ